MQALDGVTFCVAPGCIHAVVGENGAGKSTLMKVLAGAARPDGGAIYLDGKRADLRSARHAQALGIAVVYQELSLAPDLSVCENVFLGRWPRGPAGLVSFPRLHAEADAVFRSLGVNIPGDLPVGSLSVAQRQMVEIARALSLDARVLVLDEPSAVLTPPELASLFALVRRLAARGVSVLYVSHRLDEVFELVDFVTVLRDGTHISTRSIRDVSCESLVREMVGRALAEEFPPRQVLRGEVLLRVNGLSVSGRFADVSFEVRAGEVFALTGLVGSGRSSIGKALFGAVRAATGAVSVGSAHGPFRSPRQAKRVGVAYLPEDRKQDGLLLHRPLYENVSLAHLHDVATAGFLRVGDERHMTLERMRELRIKAACSSAPAATLSGGNQQKVMIARWLQRPYHVIILDEPTRGVDVGAKVEIYTLINRMVERQAAVVLITSELPEAIGMADRIAVLSRGRLAGILDNRRRDVAQEAILGLAVGPGGAVSA